MTLHRCGGGGISSNGQPPLARSSPLAGRSAADTSHGVIGRFQGPILSKVSTTVAAMMSEGATAEAAGRFNCQRPQGRARASVRFWRLLIE